MVRLSNYRINLLNNIVRMTDTTYILNKSNSLKNFTKYSEQYLVNKFGEGIKTLKKYSKSMNK